MRARSPRLRSLLRSTVPSVGFELDNAASLHPNPEPARRRLAAVVSPLHRDDVIAGLLAAVRRDRVTVRRVLVGVAV